MEKKLNRFVKYPVIIISIVICISGLRWLVSQEPWILDKVANEERLAMTFNELFLIEGNDTLSRVGVAIATSIEFFSISKPQSKLKAIIFQAAKPRKA